MRGNKKESSITKRLLSLAVAFSIAAQPALSSYVSAYAEDIEEEPITETETVEETEEVTEQEEEIIPEVTAEPEEEIEAQAPVIEETEEPEEETPVVDETETPGEEKTETQVIEKEEIPGSEDALSNKETVEPEETVIPETVETEPAETVPAETASADEQTENPEKAEEIIEETVEETTVSERANAVDFSKINVGKITVTDINNKELTAEDGTILITDSNFADLLPVFITIPFSDVPNSDEYDYSYNSITGFSIAADNFTEHGFDLEIYTNSYNDGKTYELPEFFEVTFTSKNDVDEEGNPIVEIIKINLKDVVQKIIVDSTIPSVEISYDDNSSSNGLFNVFREATIRVTGNNVDLSGITIQTTGDISEFTSDPENENANIAKVAFKTEGEHTLTVNAKSAYDNPATITYTEGTVSPNSFEIDMTDPIAVVEYNDSPTAPDGKTYTNGREATVTVKEKNFDADKVKITVKKDRNNAPETLYQDFKQNDDGDYVAIYHFYTDGNYTFSVDSVSDAAGNKGTVSYNGKNPNEFRVKISTPNVKLEYDNDDVKNDVYFKNKRTATITVDDNIDIFNSGWNPHQGIWDPEKIVQDNTTVLVNGKKKDVKFTKRNGKYVGTIEFKNDGHYTLSISYKNSADQTATPICNSKAPYDFVIDQTNPEITVEFDHNTPYDAKYDENSNKFSVSRTATITVKELNFRDSLIGFTTSADEASGTDDGITPADFVYDDNAGEYKTTVVYDKDGEYYLDISGEDLAGNEVSIEYKEGTKFADKDNPFVIDMTSAKVYVSFKNNSAQNEKYFKADRTAEIIIINETFNRNDIVIETQVNVPDFTEKDEDGFKYYVAEVVYDQDGKYTFSISGKDNAGNSFTNDDVNYADDTVAADEFVIDKTAPVLTISYSGTPFTIEGEDKRTMFFNEDVTVNFSFDEVNKNSDYYSITPIKDDEDGDVISVTKDSYDIMVKGDKESEDSLNNFKVSGTDLAGNPLTVIEDRISTDANETKGHNDKKPYTTLDSVVVDTVAPVVTVSYDKTPFTIDDANDDTDRTIRYYGSAVTVTFEFKEKNKTETYYTIVPRKDGEDESEIGVTEDKYSYKLGGESKEEKQLLETVRQNFGVLGTDKAGNNLIIVEKSVTGEEDDDLKFTAEDPYTSLVVIDEIAPVVVISYSGKPHTIENIKDKYGDARKLYYNKDVTVTFALTEGNVSKDGYFVRTIENNDIVGTTHYTSTKSIKISGSIADETKTHVYRVWGLDKAGNPLTVVENTPDGDNVTGIAAVTSTGNSVGDTENSYRTLNRVIVDIVAPTYTLSLPNVSNEFGSEKYNGEYYAYYSRTDLTANVSIAEGNFDSSRIGLGYVMGSSGLVHSATFKASKPAGGANYQEGSKKYSVTVRENGTYRFTVMGEDKAGNKLTKSLAEKNKELDYQKTSVVPSTNYYWTSIKVIDRDLDGKLYVSDSAGTKNAYLTVSSISGQNISANGLFRKVNTAYVNISTTDEKSPYKIAYTITSKGADGKSRNLDDIGFSDDNNIYDLLLSGEQKFTITSVTLLDRAGNKKTISLSGYPVYLDVTNPNSTILGQKTDIHSPVATITATTSVTNRNADGRDLFNKSVSIDLEVDDPRFTNTNISSGIDSITCVVTVDGAQVGESFTVADYSKDNEAGGSNFKRTITIPSGTYESNNIVVTLEAVDRSGNKSNKAEYKFGIDTIGPEVTVNYDNNDVQNDKYFKADRTVTINVVDRNIDNSKITITTEVGVPQSYTYTDGGGNGANDIWTKVLNYNEDGDYTLEITGTDALGNPFRSEVNYTGTAPREFTIDKTAPIIDLSFDQTPYSDNYYNQPRTGSITITEHNFRASDVTVSSINGETVYSVGFSDGSDIHTGSQYFDQEGHFDMKVEYTDLAGNPAEIKDESEFVIDLTAPEVEISGLENQPFGPGEEAIPVVTMFDTNFIKDSNFVRLTLTGNKNGTVAVAYIEDNVTAEGLTALIQNLTDTSKATDDIYTLTVSVTDRAGNVTTITSDQFSLNRYGSTFEIVSMPENYYGTELQGQVQIREINVVQIPAENVTVTVYVNGTPRTLSASEYTRSAAEFGSNGYEYIYTVNPDVFADEGTYSVVVSTVDETGNTNTSTAFFDNQGNDDAQSIEFAIDKTAPSYTVNLEDGSRKVVDASEYPVNVYPFDNMAVSKVVIDAGEYKVEFTGAELEKALKDNGYVTLTLPEADADYTVKVSVFDAAGNMIGEDEYQLLVNTSFFVRNKTAILAGGGSGAALLLLLLLLLKRRKKDEEDQAA